MVVLEVCRTYNALVVMIFEGFFVNLLKDAQSSALLRTCASISRYPNALISEETEKKKTKTLLLPTCSPSPPEIKNF
jgi:hypothetical protein